MAITNLDNLLAGMQPPIEIYKIGAATTIGRFYSPFYVNGNPGNALPPASSGAVLSGTSLSAYTGATVFNNPSSGNSYLAKFSANVGGGAGTLFLCDRLWHNATLSVTSTAVQTIKSVQFPPRDNNGSVSGSGVFIGVEVTAAMGAGTPTFGMSYTNSLGTIHSATTAAQSTTMAVGSFIPMPLVSGDTGVQSVSAFTLSATMTNGALSLVAYRVLARVDINTVNIGYSIDAISSGFPQLYNNTVPFLLWLPATVTAPVISAQMIVTQG